MQNEKLDHLLREALAPAQPDEQLNRTLLNRMEAKQASGKAGTMMKFKKKTVLVAAAAICAVTVTAAAYTGTIAYITGSSTDEVFVEFSQLEKVEKKAAQDIRAVESFENGYVFEKMDITNWADRDEDGNAINQYKGIHITYTREGSRISLSTEPVHQIEEAAEGSTPKRTERIDDIEVRYRADTYKWVEPGYKLTDEDRENLERDDYFISEGAEEQKITLVESVIWEQDGIEYTLMNTDSDGMEDELFDMAREIITQPQSK